MKHRVKVWICASICALIAGTLLAFTASPAPAATLDHQNIAIRWQLTVSAPQPTNHTAESKSPDVTFWAKAIAEDPFTLTMNSRTIYAEGRVTETGGNPDQCALGTDLEQYDGYIGEWVTVAHHPMQWSSCSGAVIAQFTCTYDPNVQWAYHTHIWLQARKGALVSPEAQAYSANNVLYWCS
jgi:hypothetical protein